MKKIIFSTIGIIILVFLVGSLVSAQGITGANAIDDDHTAREEAEGKAVWEKLQAKEVACENLSDEQFGFLGEYFMGQMLGDSHEAMNNMMIQMMGENGEEQMHIVMGKRLSGCDSSAAIPSPGVGFMPMMQMMMGGWSFGNAQDRSSPFNSNQSNNSMMNFGFAPLGGFGWIFMILWIVLIIAGIVALIKWFTNQSRNRGGQEKPFGSDQDRSPLEILKERYAKGEIDKKEFEERKKDLV